LKFCALVTLWETLTASVDADCVIFRSIWTLFEPLSLTCVICASWLPFSVGPACEIVSSI